jgi:hypothetical protein
MLETVRSCQQSLGVILPPAIDNHELPGFPEPVPGKERLPAHRVMLAHGATDSGICQPE